MVLGALRAAGTAAGKRMSVENLASFAQESVYEDV
jgi:hypothetical protein